MKFNKNFFIITIIFCFLFLLSGSAFSLEFEKVENNSTFDTLLTLENSDIVYIALSFNTGTVRDPEGKEGLNYVTEKLIEEEIKKNLNKDALTSGVEFYGQTDKEVTTYFFKVHKDKFNITYPIFLAGIISPDFGADSLELAVDNALSRREEIINHSESLSLELLEMFIYRAHPYGTPDFGTKASLENISIEDVKDFYEKFYTKNNYELGIACKEPSALLEEMRADLSVLPDGTVENILVEEPEKIDGNKVLIVKKDTPTTAVTMGFPVDFTRSDDVYYPLFIANSSFGCHRYMHGFLFGELRDKRGFNYGNYSYIEKFIEGGQDKMPETRIPRQKQYFYIWIRNLSNDNACFATKFTIFSLNKMVNEGLTGDRFELMKSFSSSNPRLWAYSPMQKLGFSMDSDFYKISYFIDYISENMKSIENEDVAKALKERFDRDVKIVIVTGEVEEIKNQLLGEADCNPVYSTTLLEEDLKVDELVMKYDLKIEPEDIEVIEAEDWF